MYLHYYWRRGDMYVIYYWRRGGMNVHYYWSPIKSRAPGGVRERERERERESERDRDLGRRTREDGPSILCRFDTLVYR